MARVFTRELDVELLAAMARGESTLQFAKQHGLNRTTVIERRRSLAQQQARIEMGQALGSRPPQDFQKVGYQLGFADPQLVAAGVPQVPFAEDLGGDLTEPSPAKAAAIEQVLAEAKRQLQRRHLVQVRGKVKPTDDGEDYSGVDAVEDHLTPARKLLARLRAQAEARARLPETPTQTNRKRRSAAAC